MSMTRERAAELFETHMPTGRVKPVQKQAYLMALSALRPVSRERVEKVWSGEWVDKGWDGDFSWKIDGRGNCWKVIECSQCQCKVSAQTNFCPHCGAPMTDEAVEMVMEKMEALHGET